MGYDRAAFTETGARRDEDPGLGGWLRELGSDSYELTSGGNVSSLETFLVNVKPKELVVRGFCGHNPHKTVLSNTLAVIHM